MAAQETRKKKAEQGDRFDIGKMIADSIPSEDPHTKNKEQEQPATQ
ncbi:hypothetical protein LRY65_00315 [Candidatus Woesebacteria bacterium]|nr:hypothetical protein [Candidatus Woesebacteria bacterium]MCD8526649.1 hypothetical protein [Candidatus Woesebacteria bacterium]MCD8545883.1 hypothetical protein [Candidatus Woesebacteria bacterium]